MFLTEGLINYGKNYKGNVSSEQTTSILNTPYFINSLVQGIKNEINESEFNSLMNLLIDGSDEQGFESTDPIVKKLTSFDNDNSLLRKVLK